MIFDSVKEKTCSSKRFEFHSAALHFSKSLFMRPICMLRCGGLMVSALNSKLSGPGSSLNRRHCALFLGKKCNRFPVGVACMYDASSVAMLMLAG